ncbi:methionyl-tRNA formyltransferase [Trueperella bialowiezensis]|uniref:Methionyl-tRNA formyltransferase n=1 Tax=Trueperella bialowiezensis TaxID=312285 RepID=A0A3S4V5D2_9ACTO|nr:methionyl-tRNA formyltransferase [Trueperella bialowiezensis]VEI12440.1 Methionyl-tRNA formyltransferase [Trueperella bialowiezensis]
MRIIFAGTPDTAVPSLDALVADHDVLGVLTRVPAPVGRKRVLTKSAVHQRAEELGLPVLTPTTLRDADVQRQIAKLGADAVAVVAYGMLVPPELLSVPRYGWINLHFSLLPRWRGAAPVQYAIAAGDTRTGTAVFQIEEGLDTGPVYDVVEREIAPTDTAGDLLAELAVSGARQLSEVLTRIEHDALTPQPQVGEATHAPRFSAKDTHIDWREGAHVVSAQSRGWWPAPGAWTKLGETRVKLGPVRPTDTTGLAPGQIDAGKRVLVGTGTTAVELDQVGPAGKQWMAAADWARGVQTSDPRFEVGGSDA